MLKRTALLGTIAGLALGAMPMQAMAMVPDGFAGTLTGGYDHTSESNGGGTTNGWSVNGAGAFGLGNSFLGAEITGGYHGFNASHNDDFHTLSFGGSLFFSPGNFPGRFGGTFNYLNLSEPHNSGANSETYGGFIEWYLSDRFTVAGRAGGYHADFDHTNFTDNGPYFGGAITGYVMPNWDIQGSVDHVSNFDHGHFSTTDFNIGTEFLFTEMFSVSGGYDYTTVSCSHCGHANVFFVALKLYTGPGTLVEHHRMGTLNWVSNTFTNAFSGGL